MEKKELKAKIRKMISPVNKLAMKHQSKLAELDALCEEYYGATPSDIDADGIIDTMQMGTGRITFREFNNEMLEILGRKK